MHIGEVSARRKDSGVMFSGVEARAPRGIRKVIKDAVKRRTDSERLSLATNHEMSAMAHTKPVRNAGRVTFGLIMGTCKCGK